MILRTRSPQSRQRPEPRPQRRGRPVAAYHRLAVALAPGDAAGRAVRIACELAADHGATVAAIAVVEVPLEVPLEEPDEASTSAAREAIRRAQAIGATYGVSLEGVVLHARDAGEAIVDEVSTRDAEVVIVAARWPQGHGRVRRLDRATDHVLKHAPCRVMLIGGHGEGDDAAPEPVFRAGRSRDYWPTGEFVDPDGATSR